MAISLAPEGPGALSLFTTPAFRAYNLAVEAP